MGDARGCAVLLAGHSRGKDELVCSSEPRKARNKMNKQAGLEGSCVHVWLCKGLWEVEERNDR